MCRAGTRTGHPAGPVWLVTGWGTTTRGAPALGGRRHPVVGHLRWERPAPPRRRRVVRRRRGDRLAAREDVTDARLLGHRPRGDPRQAGRHQRFDIPARPIPRPIRRQHHTHFATPRFRRFRPRSAILRYDPGLAASPPVRYTLSTERRADLLSIVFCRPPWPDDRQPLHEAAECRTPDQHPEPGSVCGKWPQVRKRVAGTVFRIPERCSGTCDGQGPVRPSAVGAVPR